MKYYIKSGSVEMVVTAANPQSAVGWVINHMMDIVVGDDETVEDYAKEINLKRELFDDLILIGERGFDNPDAQMLTDEAFASWVELMSAVDRLHEHFFHQTRKR